MILLIIIFVSLVTATVVFWQIPYSKTKAEFQKLASGLLKGAPSASNKVFTKEDWAALPPPVRKYFETGGFTGFPQMSSMKAVFRKVDFILSPGKTAITIDYTQYNFIDQPARIAFIDTSMYGVPFQGLDSYVGGEGGMKGVLGKTFTLFNQRGGEMDQASLVTFLSEVMLLPSAALQSYITWKRVDDLHAEATISRYGITASGIFSFRENGECSSFTTEDRTAIGMDGSKQKVKWTAYMDNYRMIGGVRQPTHLKAVWHYEQGDLVYFDSDNLHLEYR
jgi:hypothetical protein